jgi:iron complex transport system ATP-binding protein
MDMIFEVENGCFGYKKNEILRNISFSVADGEVMSVLGANGVGKTTLLKCMMGLLKWQRGTSRIDGTEISQIKNKEFWQKIAYVPQAKGAAFGYTALDMVTLGRSAHMGTFAQPKAEDKAAAMQAMEDIGITYLRDKLCTEMSGGELQMVLIARALTISPSMLVLDEPESNLDFKNQLIILETIQKLSHMRGISAVVNTHYPEHALKISDKALILNRDGSNMFGDASQIINEENMRKSFSVQVYIDRFDFRGNKYKSVVPIHLV